MTTARTHARAGRPLAAAIAALALALTAIPATAQARSARFWVTVQGRQTASWNLPRFVDSSNCFGVHWNQSHGDMTLTFNSRRTRLLVTSVGSFTNWSFGTWSAFGRDSLPATGTVTEHNSTESGQDAGRCGGSASLDPAPLLTCGTRHYAFDLNFTQVGPQRRELGISSALQDASQPPLNCPQQLPAGVSPMFTGVAALIPNSELFDTSLGKEIVLAHRPFSFTSPAGQRPGSGSANVSWTLTLTRVR